MRLELLLVQKDDLETYKADMQEAFQHGAVEGGYPMEDDAVILPEADIDRSLSAKGSIAYKVMQDGEMVGGAIVVLDEEKQSGHLDFLYVKHSVQSKGIGKFMWFEIEKRHPNIRVWETCTPYFEKRNLHFYVNVCHFHVVDFWNKKHQDPHSPFEEQEGEDEDGMFGFRKEM